MLDQLSTLQAVEISLAVFWFTGFKSLRPVQDNRPDRFFLLFKRIISNSIATVLFILQNKYTLSFSETGKSKIGVSRF
jgi:hypothetical protein